MKQLISSLLLLVLCGYTVRACDVCGCSSGGSYLGILPQYQQHFAGLHYQQQSFTSTHPTVAGETTPMQAHDHFRSLTAWGRFYPTKRLQLFAFVPYHYNTVVESGVSTDMQGIGDIRLLANYILVNHADSTGSNWKHTLLAGGGIKLPTGSHAFTNREGIILSNMQPGTGSWDFIANANYTIRYNGWGLNTDMTLRVPTVNKRDYRYGTRISSGYSVFYWEQREKLSWLPQAGIRYEWSQTDYSSYAYRIRNAYSGGYQWYLNGGTTVYLNRIALQGLISLPVKEHYAGGLVKSHARYEMQVQYLF